MKYNVTDLIDYYPCLLLLPTVFIRLIRARTIRKRQKNWAARGYLSARLIK